MEIRFPVSNPSKDDIWRGHGAVWRQAEADVSPRLRLELDLDARLGQPPSHHVSAARVQRGRVRVVRLLRAREADGEEQHGAHKHGLRHGARGQCAARRRVELTVSIFFLFFFIFFYWKLAASDSELSARRFPPGTVCMERQRVHKRSETSYPWPDRAVALPSKGFQVSVTCPDPNHCPNPPVDLICSTALYQHLEQYRSDLPPFSNIFFFIVYMLQTLILFHCCCKIVLAVIFPITTLVRFSVCIALLVCVSPLKIPLSSSKLLWN